MRGSSVKDGARRVRPIVPWGSASYVVSSSRESNCGGGGLALRSGDRAHDAARALLAAVSFAASTASFASSAVIIAVVSSELVGAAAVVEEGRSGASRYAVMRDDGGGGGGLRSSKAARASIKKGVDSLTMRSGRRCITRFVGGAVCAWGQSVSEAHSSSASFAVGPPPDAGGCRGRRNESGAGHRGRRRHPHGRLQSSAQEISPARGLAVRQCGASLT